MRFGLGNGARSAWSSIWPSIWRTAAVTAVIGLCACSPQSLLLRAAADQLAGQGQADEEDLLLARDASAFYLKLSESVLRQTPGHLPLAEAVAGGFTQYAYAFIALEADRIESTDAKAAQRMRERAARLYARAKRHAMAALEQHRPGFAEALAGKASALQLPADQVAVAYWAAAAWGAYISLSKDQPDAVADLPQAIALARLAWARDPDHGDGALASLMGSFEAARPGGSMRQAETYFNRAIAAGAGRSAGPWVAKAETLALAAGDRAGFEAMLRQAISIATGHPSLANALMRERAQWLLDSADDRF
jgi:predicted anti-sigma-YlaC factor YlaD